MTRAAPLVLAALLVLAGTATAGAAKLELLDRDPVVVRGTGFEPLERVRVTAHTREGPLVRRVVATRAGRFVVRLGALSAESCERAITVIRAVGARGTVAALRLALRECAAP